MSRMIGLFRSGQLPAKPDIYEAVSGCALGQLASDQNVRAAGFGELGVALALLQHGRIAKLWSLSPPVDDVLAAGALSSVANWPSAAPRAIFLVRSATIALDLEKNGAFANGNSIVIHADDVWQQMRSASSVSARKRLRTGSHWCRHAM